MSFHTKLNGTWREICQAHVKVNGTWRQITQIYTKVNGVWKPVWVWGVSASSDIPYYNRNVCTSGVYCPNHNSSGYPHFHGTKTSTFKTIAGTTATISYTITLGGDYSIGDNWNDGSGYIDYHNSGKVTCSYTGATVSSYSKSSFTYRSNSRRVYTGIKSGSGTNSVWINSDYVDDEPYGDSVVSGTCTVKLNVISDTLTITHSGSGMFSIKGTMDYTTPGA